MGMYNEVFKDCPKCNHRCEVQIGQIVLGFGEFNLDDPNSLADKLTGAEIVELGRMLKDKTFWCVESQGGCGTHFTAFGETHEMRMALASQFFGNGE